MSPRSSFALGAAISAIATLFAVSPFLSARRADSSSPSHLFETALLIPEWCSSDVEAIRALTLRPIDIADNWDSGVRYLAVVTGNVEERERTSQAILSKCYGKTITFSGENADLLFGKEFQAMKSRGQTGHVIVTIKSNEIVMQVGRNVGQ